MLSEESITTAATSDNIFAQKLSYIHNSKIRVKCKGNFFKIRQKYLFLMEMQ